MYTLVKLAFFLTVSSALPSSLKARDPTNDCPATAASTTFSNRICTASCAEDRAGGDYAATYTGSFSGCLSACAADTSCATAQYSEDNGYCYFKSTVNALVSSTNIDTVDCCPTVATIASTGRICTTSCGQDRPGGDYGASYTGTIDACISACGADPKCVTAQFSLSNGYCYFKDSFHAFSSNLNVDTVDCCPGPVTSGNRTCTTTCGADRPGGDYANTYTGNVDDCIAACAADSSCVTAQYHISNGYCYFKSSANALVSSLTTDTIDCTTSSD